jgi:hypothetical protein
VTYEEYKQGVIEQLLEEGKITGTDQYRDRQIRVALLEALRFFPTFRPDRTLTLSVEGQLEDGYVGFFGIPSGINIREAKIVPSEWGTEEEMEGVDHEDRLGPLEYYPWENRQTLINGLARKCDLFYSLGPDHATILIHPKLDETMLVQISYEGLVTKFRDDDVIHVPEELEDMFITCCSDYVRGKIAKDIDRNTGMYGANLGEFKRQLRAIYQEVPR